MPWKMSCDCALWRAKCRCENVPDQKKYKVVVVDPPWDISFGTKTLDDLFNEHRKLPVGTRGAQPGYARLDYETMSDVAIGTLPVRDHCAVDAWVFLWTIQGKLRQSFDVLEAWGARYSFTMTWAKSFGIKPQNRPQYNSEFVLVGALGAPKFRDERQFFTVNRWKQNRSHSEKPEEFYDLLRRVTEGPRLDMFNRRKIAGFDGWGDESPGVHGTPDHYQIPSELIN